MIELPFYLPVLWYLTDQYGIQGAATAWTLRVAIDAVLLYSAALLLLPPSGKTAGRAVVASVIAAAILVGAVVITESVYKLAYWISVMSLFLVVGWKKILLRSERALVRRHLPAKLW
jgi:hypothetical protein